MVKEAHALNVRVFVDLLGPMDNESNYLKAKKWV